MKRILVAGGGLIGSRHLQSVADHPACELVGLVDPDPSVEALDSVRRFADLTEVSDEVDGIILATPTHLHADQGIFAAQKGWHMLIEKPVADDLQGARRLAQAVSDAGVGSLVGHHRRYHASIHQLRSLLQQGRIGTPVTATMIWAMRKPDEYFQGNWRTVAGSPVMINLVHDIDLLRFVIGEVAVVSAVCGQGIRGSERIESGAVALVFENGATGTISFADTTPSPWGFEAATGENPNIGTTCQDMLWITGTGGAVSFPSMSLWQGTNWSEPAQFQTITKAENTKAPLDAQLDHFVEVMHGATPLIDVNDATRTLDITLEVENQLRAQMTGVSNGRSAFA